MRGILVFREQRGHGNDIKGTSGGNGYFFF